MGTRYAWDGRAGVVVQVWGDGRLVVEDQSAGGQEVVTRAALTTAWREGALRFVVRGAQGREEKEGTRGSRAF